MSLLASTLLPLAACADQVLSPAAPEARNTRLDVVNSCAGPTGAPRVAQVSVTDSAYGAVPNDGVDDTCALQKAVYAAHDVHLPTGTYKISQPVLLPSRSRVFGADSSLSRIQMSAGGISAFATRGNGSAFVDSVTVEALGFHAPSDAGYVLSAVSSRHVLVQNVSAQGMRLVHVGTHLPIDVWDGTPDPAATAGLTSESHLSADIRVLNNRATGTYNGVQVGGLSGAIFIQYSVDVTITGNTLDNFQNGIQWWGGDANPGRGGVHANPRWLRNAWIEGNTVTNTEAGIWGGMGQDVTVIRNYVESCADVCLDAEGDVNTLFQENHARNAGHAVADVYHYGTNVRFAWNDLRQDGTRGNLVFHTHNDTQDPGQISIYAYNNVLRFTGAAGVGRAMKEAANYLLFSNNTLENTVIDMLPGNNGGGIYMTGNGLTFDRSTGGLAAIRAGNNWGPGGWPATPVNAHWELEVGGNHVSSTAAQGATTPGILVAQLGGYQIDSWIHHNVVRDFGRSIDIQRADTTKTFLVEDNQHSAAIPSPATNVVVQNNTQL